MCDAAFRQINVSFVSVVLCLFWSFHLIHFVEKAWKYSIRFRNSARSVFTLLDFELVVV